SSLDSAKDPLAGQRCKIIQETSLKRVVKDGTTEQEQQPADPHAHSPFLFSMKKFASGVTERQQDAHFMKKATGSPKKTGNQPVTTCTGGKTDKENKQLVHEEATVTGAGASTEDASEKIVDEHEVVDEHDHSIASAASGDVMEGVEDAGSTTSAQCKKVDQMQLAHLRQIFDADFLSAVANIPELSEAYEILSEGAETKKNLSSEDITHKRTRISELRKVLRSDGMVLRIATFLQNACLHDDPDEKVNFSAMTTAKTKDIA
ncbi:unnamed protein product, partial [Amoebophrya sp. A25]